MLAIGSIAELILNRFRKCKYIFPGVCNSDFLTISGWGRKCGITEPQQLPEKIKLDTQDLTLRFRSDGRHQGRGFWLEFIGESVIGLDFGKELTSIC